MIFALSTLRIVEKFEIRNQKSEGFDRGWRMPFFELLISNFEFTPLVTLRTAPRRRWPRSC